MAKTSVKNKTCAACGANVRQGSLFCYNCGEAVAPEAAEVKSALKQKTVKEALVEEELKEKTDFRTTRLDGAAIEQKAQAAELKKEAPIPKPDTAEPETKLKTAANLRRKPKTFQKKTVEIVWEEPDQSPNKWFPLVAIGLVVFVALIFYLAMYLK